MSAVKVCPQCGTEYGPSDLFCPRDGSALRGPHGTADLVGQIVGQYHILRKLGEGGMGQVYLAEHVKMGRKSAIKVMNPGMIQDADAIGRFNREAANASRINHPNVAAIYDFGETADGMIFLAMEFIEGEPLTKLLARTGALPPARAAEIARQVAEALEVAHDYGIVHRDLKPDNIMIARGRDGGDVAKVVDFGIAKAGNGEGQKVTKTGMVVGTPEYMSPEQLSGDALDGRSDLYSLGLVTFSMLAGTLPFPGSTSQEAMIARLTERPRTLLETRPDVRWPPSLQSVMDRALARDAGDRYLRAGQFGRDLMRAVQDMPETRAREAGTLVLDAVPPTIARGGGTAPMAVTAHGGGSAIELEADEKGGPAMSDGTARPHEGGGTNGGVVWKRLMPASVSAAVLVIAITAWSLRSPRSTDTATGATSTRQQANDSTTRLANTGARMPTDSTTSTSPAPTSMPPRDSAAGGANHGTVAPASKPPAPPPHVTPGGTPPSISGAQSGNASPAKEFQSIETEFDEATKLEGAQQKRALQQLQPRLSRILSKLSGDDLARARMSMSEIAAGLNDSEEACRYARMVEHEPIVQKRAAFMVGNACQ